MLVLMCGLPHCGKSTAIDIIAEKSKSSLWIVRPEEWLPDNLDELDQNEQRHYQIECWRTAVSDAESRVDGRPDSTITVLDCANSKIRPLNGLLKLAKRNGHRTAMLYVNSRPSQCEARAGDKWVGLEIIKSYIQNIRDSLPKFKNKCDRVIIIDNTDTIDVLEQKALDAWSRLCQIT